MAMSKMRVYISKSFEQSDLDEICKSVSEKCGVIVLASGRWADHFLVTVHAQGDGSVLAALEWFLFSLGNVTIYRKEVEYRSEA